MKLINLLLLLGLITIAGCQSTQKAPETLDNYSKTVRAGFVSYKRATQAHRAFAVAKYRKRDFFGYGTSYPTVAGAEKRALDECHKLAQEYREGIQCFIYHSE